jgi:phytoene dehydrogenase-like protein
MLFRGPRARALLGGMAAHSMLPLDRPISAAFGLVLAILGHTVGWPIVRGGSQRLAAALSTYFTNALGGQLETGRRVTALQDFDLDGARAVLFDLAPRDVVRVAGDALPRTYRRALGRYRYGPGVCKVDWALETPIPWTAPECHRAGTVHVGGTLDEIAASEAAVWRGEHPPRPFVIVAQPSLIDPSRAPAGRHTGWAYCHVPPGSARDMHGAIEAQIERFAPGFTARILARRVHTAVDMEAHNPNYVGGDINTGVQDLAQLWTRPAARRVPYSTPNRRLFICSSATPPGGGVHGMCGYHAARAALRRPA